MSSIVKVTEPELDIGLLKRTIAKGSTDSEFDMFVQVCRKLRLDPFSRQIFLVKRWDSKLRCEVAQPQVSIDGFRLVAERTGEYRGQTAPQWCGPDGVWTDVWLSDGPPAAARCGVFRAGFSEPLVRVARYKSYVQTTKDGAPNRMWGSMPEVMLSKCAEMLALRAAFPNELSGVYGVEEMGQASNDEPATARRASLDDIADKHPLVTAGLEPVDEINLDEYGLPIPSHPCPKVRSGKPDAGKLWSELDTRRLIDMYNSAKAAMTPQQMEWCEYLMMRNSARNEAKNVNV